MNFTGKIFTLIQKIVSKRKNKTIIKSVYYNLLHLRNKVLVYDFNDISAFVFYLMPKPSFLKNSNGTY